MTARKSSLLVVVGKGLLASQLGVYAPSLKSVNASLLKTKFANERWSKNRLTGSDSLACKRQASSQSKTS